MQVKDNRNLNAVNFRPISGGTGFQKGSLRSAFGCPQSCKAVDHHIIRSDALMKKGPRRDEARAKVSSMMKKEAMTTTALALQAEENHHDGTTFSNNIYTTLCPTKQVKETPQRKQVNYSPSAIASYCGRGERSGKDWKCNCPICGRHSLSVAYGKIAAILIKCWHCEACDLNDGYTAQRQWLVDAGLLPEDASSIKEVVPVV
jgi:hypothetical protein